MAGIMRKTVNFVLLICFLIVEFNSSTAVNSYGDCKSPYNTTGNCIELSECKSLFAILQMGVVSDADRDFLAKSQCGYFDNKVLICCQDPQNLTNLLPNPPKCGRFLEDRIIGGSLTKINEHPWTALVEHTKPDYTKLHICGGTLINNRYVVTAAHCIRGRSIPSNWLLNGVRLGEWDTTTNPDCDETDCADAYLYVSVEESIPHFMYEPSSTNQLYDIALLRLSENVRFSQFIFPVCLPKDDNLRDKTFNGEEMVVVGWGRTESLRSSPQKLKARINAVDLESCRSKYNLQSIFLASSQMCAGGEIGVSSCHGDSGGPLVISERVNGIPHYFFTGIVSFGPTDCGKVNWPTVFTRVGAYIDWIQKSIRP